jgi:hypothetical protein
MAGAKSKRKSTTAKVKAAPAAADSNIRKDQGHVTAQDPCAALMSTIHGLLATRDCSWGKRDVYEELWAQVQAVLQFEQGLAAGQHGSIHETNKFCSVTNIGSFLVQLVSRLLSARKQPRDWKQPDYSYAVSQALSAAAAVLQWATQQEDKAANELTKAPA